jgi:Protein of unknown function, DUF547
MTKLSYYILFLLTVTPLLTEAQSKPPSHEIYDRLLKKNVTADGKVNYKAFIKDSVELNRYLAILSSTPPDEKTWSKNEQMVFWINAYNALTIKLITKYYPLKSIKDIGTGIQIPFVNTPWTVRFFKIGNDRMDLDNIEHGRLRKKFDDPRVHMALVCASKSCPILLNEAYDAKRMDEQMAKQATAFLADPFRNKMSADKPQLSMLFKWYGGDFNKKGGSVRSFINAHSPIKIKPDAKISYLDYDWGLNEQ